MRTILAQVKSFHNIKLLRGVQYLSWASVPFVLVYPSTFSLPAFLVGVFFITMLGSSAGLHRYFGHKSFKTGKLRHWFLGFVTTLSTQGSIPFWVQYHRAHHVFTDTEDDPISPTFVGFWKSFFSIQDINSYKGISPKNIAREMRDPAVKFFHEWYWIIILTYVLILGIIEPTLLINAYLLPVFMIRFTFGLQNTFGHGIPVFFGYRNHETKDKSLNSIFVNIITFALGETLHNNHHANPAKYNYQERWYELDLTGFVIKRFFSIV